MTSSRRFRNSGLNTFFSSSFTFSASARSSACSSPRREAERLALRDVARADVRRHDHDGVLEVDHAAVVVRQVTFVEHLQQDVEHVRMRLLDLVEQDDRVRLAADGLRQRARILVADVARRRADEPRHGELLHVLAHVDANQRRLVGEQELRQRRAPAPSCRRRSGRRRRTSRSDGCGSLSPARLRRIAFEIALIASSWPITVCVQLVFHPQQARGLRLLQTRHRNARPAADDERDLLLAEHRAVRLAPLLPTPPASA